MVWVTVPGILVLSSHWSHSRGAMSSEKDPSCQYRVGFSGVIEQTPSSKISSKRDYLVDAAKQLHVAQERDANEEYEAAFSHYKHGVELLLNGVTVDPSRERRDAVKRKISQYLKRAEEIFNCHLQRPAGYVSGAAEGYSSLRFRPIRVLNGAVENLKRCRVLEIIDKVQLVHDPSSATTFILKSLMKSGRSGHGAVTVIPQCVPYMVQLQRFYVSEDSLYLQLQHIPGGRLWGHLGKYQSHVANVSSQPSSDLSYSGSGDSEAHNMNSDQDRTQAHKPIISQQSRSGCPDSNNPAEGVPEYQVRLWGAQLILALDTLHQEGVLCRDLNPRNLLMGEKGDVCLTYFGQWREVDHECCSEAAERLYVAPEVLGVGAVNEACDWWSLGVLLYEMLTGQSLYKNLISGVSAQTEIPFTEKLSPAAVSLLTELLRYDPDQRLGSGPGGVQRIKSHPFFSDIQWKTLA
ncbi:ribosomal protein S6 kinase-like 1 isoform X2 [Pseudophryne corroboree]|uniref:ribosomal protein S6 kinase-like 1 isoform X2 n=1 Tax=Pseudophryne corroboree TaxID=495146 RepID=UPI00308151A4